MRCGQRAIVVPQRIGHDVGDDDGLPPIGGGPAGTRPGANAGAVDGLGVVGRKARRCAMAQVNAVLVEQENGAEYSRQLRLDEMHEFGEHLAERCARGNHLENAGLAVAQVVFLLAPGDVLRDADKATDIAVVVAQGNLRRRKPLSPARRVEHGVLVFDHRLAGCQDLLLPVTIAARGIRGVKVEIGQADHVARMRAEAVGGERLVGDDEAASRILDPEVEGHPVDQRLQREAFLGQSAVGLEFGDVLVGDDQAAIGDGAVVDPDLSSVAELDRQRPRRRIGHCGAGQGDVNRAVHRRHMRGDVAFDDFFERDLRGQLCHRGAVDLDETLVDADQPLAGIEQAHAAGGAFGNRLIACSFGFERAAQFALRYPLRDGGKLRQPGKAGCLRVAVGALPGRGLLQMVSLHDMATGMLPRRPARRNLPAQTSG